MRHPLFDRNFNNVLERDPYFQQQYQVTREIGLSPYQKISAVFRILAYGVAADMQDEYLRIGASNALQCLKRFCAVVVYYFSDEYLREPTADDRARILAKNASRGFSGCLGSLDCMHWNWKSCPKLWQATYQNYKKHQSIILEAIASKDGWFWHAFFGIPGSLNDINVMQHSMVFEAMMNRDVPVEPYKINGVRKDIERDFGQLQGRWAIIRQPAKGWRKEDLHYIMLECIILHNMICEYERGILPCDNDIVEKENTTCRKKKKKDDEEEEENFKAMTGRYAEITGNYARMHYHDLHDQMKDGLIEHIWDFHGD